MKYFWSPSTKGCYNSIDHAGKMPEDVIEITALEYAEFMQNSDRIDLGPEGRPVIKSSIYYTLNGAGDAFEITPENQALKDTQETEETRITNIKTGKENSRFRKVTVEKAYDFIDNKLDAASSATEVKEAIRDILKEMAPHIID